MAKWEGSDYSDIDVQTMFLDENIPFRTRGKNISAGWIGVNCPFCGEQNNHCGVNLDSKRYSCWVCSETGTILKLIAVILNITYAEAHRVLDNYRGFYYEAPVRELSDKVIYPSNMTELSDYGLDYLESRGFDPFFIEEQYRLKETRGNSVLKIKDMEWRFKCRIIIPIIMNREVVSYTGRDWTGKQDPRYQNAPLEAGIIPMTECVYNIDSIKDRALIVEGATDVWKLGPGSMATLGVKFSHEQIRRIVNLNLKKAAILFDAGAMAQAKLLAEALGPFIPDLKAYFMEDDLDPGKLDSLEARKLRMDLIGV